MKAIIMAGGEGTRLRPMSLGLPKPMVNLFDKPALEYIINLLKNNGITQACLTLKYMPESIINFIKSRDFGIELRTVVEETALGTAGGVKNCSDFLGTDDFLVISGDCVCDFDLTALTLAHKTKNAEVTIALYEHPEPLEYGLCLTRADGRIERFVEKPQWENVVTNKINTGIYVISPSVLDEIPCGVPYDFGKELFPALLEKNRSLYGHVMPGYWCDIGSPGAYLQCCSDILSGKARIDIGAEQKSPGVFCRSALPVGSVLIPPVYIGDGVTIKDSTKIGPCAVIGGNSAVLDGASVSNCALDGAAVLEGAAVEGAIVGGGAVIGRGAFVREGAVIGEGCFIGNNAVIAQSVKLWPDRKIPSGAFIKDDVTHGLLKNGLSFTARGIITGQSGAELTPASALKLGETIGALTGRAGIGCESSDCAQAIADAIACGIRSRGGGVVRIDSGLASCVSFAAASLMLPLAVCVNQNGTSVSITFFGDCGRPVSGDFERRLLSPGAGNSSGIAQSYGSEEPFGGALELYAASAARHSILGAETSVRISVTGGGERNRALKRALTLLDCSVTGEAEDIPCFSVGDGGMSLYAVCEDGRRLLPEQLLVLAAAIELSRGKRELAAAIDAPEALDALARRFGAAVYRLGRDGEKAERLYTGLPALRDGVFMGALICGWMKEKGMTLAELSGGIPRFSLVTREMRLRGGCGEVMAVLAAAACEAGAELSAGVGLRLRDGFVRVSPLRTGNGLRIRSEGTGEEIAQELCADVIRQIQKIDTADLNF